MKKIATAPIMKGGGMTYPNLHNSVEKNLGWHTAKYIKGNNPREETLLIFSPSFSNEVVSEPPTDIWIHGRESLEALRDFLIEQLKE